jgi:polysaccharide biosynthesis protein PslG
MYRWQRWLRRWAAAGVIACAALIASIAMLGACIKSPVTSTWVSTGAGPLRLGIAYGDTLTWLPDQELAATLNDASALGVKWIRADLSWGDIQPDSANAYKWERFDRVVDAAGRRGLTLLPIISYTPSWARPAGCFTDKCAPANADQFAAFAGEAASRYGGITTWEIWNEENSQRFWQPQPDPAAYANLLERTTASIRKSNPAAKILVGGLSIIDTDQGGITPQDFLRVLVRSATSDAFDGVGLHPYTYPNLASDSGQWVSPRADAGSVLQSIRNCFTDAGLPAIPIWITEYGAPTGGEPESSDHVTETRQAEIAADAVKTAAADEGVAALIWYTYRDSGSDLSDPESYYGLRRADGSKKPSYDAFRLAIANSPR